MQRNDMFEAIADALLERGLAASEDLASARQLRSAQGGSELIHLMCRGAVDPDAITEFLAAQFGLPVADDAFLASADRTAFERVPFELAYDLGLLPVRHSEGGRLAVAVVDPSAMAAVEEAEFHAGASFDLRVVSVARFAVAFERVSGQTWRVPSSDLGRLRLASGSAPAMGRAVESPGTASASPAVAARLSTRPATPVVAPDTTGARAPESPVRSVPAPEPGHVGTLAPLTTVVAAMGDPTSATAAVFQLLERTLAVADGREAVGRQIVETLGLVYPTVVLLSLRLPRVTVWDAHLGSGAPPPVGASFEAPEGGLWHQVAVSGVAFLGEIPGGDPVRRGLPRVFGKASLAAPLRLGDRRIGVLVLDSGYNGDLAAPGRQIERLAGWVEQSLKRVIIRRKARSPAP